MKIRLEPLTAEHCVELHRQGTIENYLGADQIVDHWQTYRNGPAFAGVDDNGVLAASGVFTIWEGVGEGWAILTPRAKGPAVIRAFRETFRLIKIAHNYHRIQASIRADFSAGIRFAEWMGFEHEGIMRKFDNLKNDYVRMAHVG